jgi:hypothetical protein
VELAEYARSLAFMHNTSALSSSTCIARPVLSRSRVWWFPRTAHAGRCLAFSIVLAGCFGLGFGRFCSNCNRSGSSNSSWGRHGVMRLVDPCCSQEVFVTPVTEKSCDGVSRRQACTVCLGFDAGFPASEMGDMQVCGPCMADTVLYGIQMRSLRGGNARGSVLLVEVRPDRSAYQRTTTVRKGWPWGVQYQNRPLSVLSKSLKPASGSCRLQLRDVSSL